MGWPGVTTPLVPASKEEQRGQHVPGLLNGVRGDVTHQVSRVVVKQVGVHGLGPRHLSAQLPDLGSCHKRPARGSTQVSAETRILGKAWL